MALVYWLPIAGLFAVGRRLFFNTMLSRPIVIAGIIGLAQDRFSWCLLGGLLFEVIGLMDIPVGTRISFEDSFSAFVYSIIISFVNTAPTVEISLFAISFSLFLLFPATYTNRITRKINSRILDYYVKIGVAGNEWKVIFLGELVHYVRGVLVYGAASILGLFICNRFIVNFSNTGDIPYIALNVLLFFLAGYFCGFFHASKIMKFPLLLAGGAIAWFFL